MSQCVTRLTLWFSALTRWFLSLASLEGLNEVAYEPAWFSTGADNTKATHRVHNRRQRNRVQVGVCGICDKLKSNWKARRIPQQTNEVIRAMLYIIRLYFLVQLQQLIQVSEGRSQPPCPVKVGSYVGGRTDYMILGLLPSMPSNSWVH